MSSCLFIPRRSGALKGYRAGRRGYCLACVLTMVDRIFCIDIQDLFHRKSHVRGVATDGVLVEKSFKQLDPKRFHIY